MDGQELKKGAKLICAGLLAHADAGKTTLTEQLLYLAGAIRKAGSVDDGTAQTDWLDVERRRGISVRAASSRLTLGDTAVNLIDTPGHADFSGEVERSLGALDGAVLLLSAVEGVQAQTKLIWKAMDTLRLPGIIFLNKIDRAGSDCKKVLSQLAREFPGSRFFPMQSVRGEGKIDAAVSGPDWEDASFQENLLLELADFDPEIEEAVL